MKIFWQIRLVESCRAGLKCDVATHCQGTEKFPLQFKPKTYKRRCQDRHHRRRGSSCHHRLCTDPQPNSPHSLLRYTLQCTDFRKSCVNDVHFTNKYFHKKDNSQFRIVKNQEDVH